MITSINLCALPFLGNCDSTRAQMASKQVVQSLTHKNCEIPYVISEDYRHLVDNSSLGILKAPEDGKVIFKNDDCIVVYYTESNQLKIIDLPILHKTNETFCSELRESLNENDNFSKGDVIYSYDCFRSGVPSYGYNVMTGYLNLFGFTHEDAVVVSESFANDKRHKHAEIVYIPIHEYSLLQPLYDDDLKYFPQLGQRIINGMVASILQPKGKDTMYSTTNLKQQALLILKSMSVPDLINLQNKSVANFTTEHIKTKVEHGVVSGFKVHRLRDNVQLVDQNLQNILEQMHGKYITEYVTPNYKKLSNSLGQDGAKWLARKYMVYKDTDPVTNRKNFKNCVYLLEVEIVDEHGVELGDKICNRYANKGKIYAQLYSNI